MDRVRYVEVQCKSALNRVQGMPFQWSLNPYRGCRHGCVYCYARGYHGLMGRDLGAGFDAEIEIKVGFPAVLRRELQAGRASGLVALGTATDPYQPCEGRYRITRATLEAMLDYRVPLSMVTKSPMVVRDVDLLAELSRRTGGQVRVFFTVTTMDLSLWRQIEPGTANPYKRLAAMSTLQQAGVRAGILCAPILPGVTDEEQAIDAVARAAFEYGAASFGWSPLRLGPQVKEYYLAFVLARFPVLLPRYELRYGERQHVDPAYLRTLERRVERVRARYGFDQDSMRQRQVVPPTQTVRQNTQLALPLPSAPKAEARFQRSHR